MGSALWQFISTLVGGLIVVSSNFLLHYLQNRDEERKQKREDSLRQIETNRSIRLKQVESDAACWRLVKHHLDELWWETESIAPGVHGTTAVGYVQPVNIKWAQHWNAISKITGTFALHDSVAQETLDKLRVVARRLSVSAGMAEYSRKNVQDPRHTMQLSADAKNALDEFRKLYAEVNKTIRDSVGFNAVYSAPLITPQEVDQLRVQLDENDYKF